MVGKKGGLGMEQRFALDGGVGALSVREEGPRASIAAERPDDGRGLSNAYRRGRGGSVLLGTMTPENGRLLVRRTFSLDELRRRGAWPVLGGAAEMAFSFRGEETPPQGWSWAEGGRLELGERRLRQSASRLGRILCRRDGEGLTLACPFEPEREFPFPELFCLGRIEGFGGRRFVLFSFDGRGRPILRET